MPASDDLQLEEEFAQRKLSRATFSRLYLYLQPYRRTLALNLIFTVVATLSSLVGPLLIQQGMDRYLRSGVASGESLRGMYEIAGFYLLNLLAGWGLSILQVRSAIAVGQGAMNDLRLAVFRHIQELSLSYFDRTHQGRIIARADSDIEALDRILTWGANHLLSSVITLAGVVALMLQYEWRLCLAVGVVIAPLGYATHWFQRHGMAAYREMRRVSSRITSVIAENISGVRIVQAFAREEENLDRFRRLHDEYGVRAVEASRIFHTYMPVVGFLSGLGVVIVLGYGGHLAMTGEISVGELAAFILYIGMFFGPIHTMGDLYNSLLSTAASAERIFQLLDTDPQVRDRPGALPLPRIDGTVRFDRVGLRYETTPAGSWVLEDIDFEVRAGETVALVGATGSGKTSIISLLARFYEPQKGRILIDDHDIAGVVLLSLHRQIGIVTQDNFLFSGTVMENLKFGRPEATDDEVMAAARTLGTHETILKFKDGYGAKVSERGGNFSAGERQLLCFTRALVAGPRILILDEATSAVDAHAESVIQNALEKLFERRTCFVIAHRLSTVRHAHQILVLEHGRIVERGTHEQLLARGGHYSELHAQFVRAQSPSVPQRAPADTLNAR